MCCSSPLPSFPTYCLRYPSACSFNITLIKEVPDQLHEEKWGGLPWASGDVTTMGSVFFQMMIKYLAHKYQYYVILKSSQQIMTIWETLSLGRFESSKVSLRNKTGFWSRVGKSSGSGLILCLSSCPSPPSSRLKARFKSLGVAWAGPGLLCLLELRQSAVLPLWSPVHHRCDGQWWQVGTSRMFSYWEA